ncbi:uncharacterized protein BX664DRAFT_61615 [Halteromyces radiatus]|uniref:uncharacterized protein n=1 Tax=Halteromyces radiatus TaxID=101107 RepID=UPI00221E7166|nr:uncharacterized protein BX664DRAFT_61615 [Halteromyces radiatus]KAI8096572.1 hypothetical protein BX664DRAFT_61615 [Halteromyces radiatus]
MMIKNPHSQHHVAVFDHCHWPFQVNLSNVGFHFVLFPKKIEDQLLFLGETKLLCWLQRVVVSACYVLVPIKVAFPQNHVIVDAWTLFLHVYSSPSLHISLLVFSILVVIGWMILFPRPDQVVSCFVAVHHSCRLLFLAKMMFGFVVM